MSDLRARLDDLLADTPSYVGVPDAPAAWRAGARRRVRRRIGAGALVVVVALLVGAGIGALPRPGTVQPADREGGADGYPTRVAGVADADPARPGSMAGFALTLEGDRYLVSADGRVHPLPTPTFLADSFPALSDDGRMLGYLETETRYVLRDLVAGTEVVVDGLGGNREGTDRTWWTQGQVPAYFSPDGSRLALYASRGDETGPGTALVDRAGVLHALPPPRLPSGRRSGRGGHLLGWQDDARIAWLQEVRDGGRDAVDLVLTETSGDEVGRVRLEVPAREVPWLSQWSGSLSPDRSTVFVRGDDGAGYLLDAATGARTDDGVIPDIDLCLPSWQAGALLMVDRGALRDLDATPVVATDPDLDLRCLQLVPAALDGDPHRGLAGVVFGARTGWLAWHWQEVGLGAVGALAWLGLLVGLQRRRARRRVSG